MKKLLILLNLVIIISCCDKVSNNIENRFISDSAHKFSDDSVNIVFESPFDKHESDGYDELSNEDSLDIFSISEYNTDISGIENIERPGESKILNSKFSKKKLFGVWVQDPGPETPHATFELDEKFFYVVDYDGDGNMPYLIKEDSITVYYNDFITKGKILESKNSGELTIIWKNSKRPTVYYTWKN